MSDLSASKWSTEAFSFSTPTPRSSAPSRPASTTVSSTEKITVPETFRQMVHSVATKGISTTNVGTYTENRNNNQGRTTSTSTQPSHGSLATGANTPKLQSTFVNPYQAYVKNLDPEGTLGDGRDYVGKKSHLLDRPTAPTAANPRPAGTFGAQTLYPPVQKAPAPAPKRNFFMNSKNSGPPASGLDFGTAKPRPPPGAPSAGMQNNQRRRPSASSASSSSSKPGRDYNKAHAWSGKPLATTEDFDFFGTAKPKPLVNPPERAPLTRKPLGNNNNHFDNDRSNSDRSNSDRSNNDRINNDRINNDRSNNDRSNNDRSNNDRNDNDGDNDDRSINDKTDNDGDNDDRNNIDRNNNDRSNNASALVSPPPPAPFTQRPGSENGWNDTRQHGIRQYDAQQQVYRSPQQRPQQRAPGKESGEWNDFRNTAQHYLDALENTPDAAGSKPFISNTDDVNRHRTGLVANRQAAHGAAAKAEPSDNPIFMQYPIGDGCHLTLAMYVDRDPDTALHRFQGMTRYRQSSTYKEQSIDEMTEIFKRTLMDEKENVSG